MSIIEREQTTLPDFETWPIVEDEKPKEGTIAYEALRLDRLFPGWADRIDTKTLTMCSPEHCVLAQGAYVQVERKRFLRRSYTEELHLGYGRGHDLVLEDSLKRKEVIAGGAYSSGLTRDAWVTEIEKRRTR